MTPIRYSPRPVRTFARRVAHSPFVRDMAVHVRTELPAACWAVLATIVAFALINIGVEIGILLGNGGLR